MDWPNSFRDPRYDEYEQAAARKHGIDPALVRGIRLFGEKSNNSDVSSAGARTVYQFIPGTRQLIINRWGVDPWSSPQAAAEGAVLLLKDNLVRNKGNVEAAVGEYHGGTNRRAWGPQNTAYRQRVMSGLGGASTAQSSMPAPTPQIARAPQSNQTAMRFYGGGALDDEEDTQRPAQSAASLYNLQPERPQYESLQSALPSYQSAMPVRDYAAELDKYIRRLVDEA